MTAGVLRRRCWVSAWSGELICDGSLVMSACDATPAAVAFSRLDSVAELRKEL